MMFRKSTIVLLAVIGISASFTLPSSVDGHQPVQRRRAQGEGNAVADESGSMGEDGGQMDMDESDVANPGMAVAGESGSMGEDGGQMDNESESDVANPGTTVASDEMGESGPTDADSNAANPGVTIADDSGSMGEENGGGETGMSGENEGVAVADESMGEDGDVADPAACSVPVTDNKQCTGGDCSCEYNCPADMQCGNCPTPCPSGGDDGSDIADPSETETETATATDTDSNPATNPGVAVAEDGGEDVADASAGVTTIFSTSLFVSSVASVVVGTVMYL